MKEAVLTQTQVEDSFADLESARDAVFTLPEIGSGIYEPDKDDVPRPNFALFEAALFTRAEQNQLPAPLKNDGCYEVSSPLTSVMRDFEGLRGFARIHVKTASGTKQLVRPAIVLAGGERLALLLAEAESPAYRVSDMQHSLLDTEYIKDMADVSENHEKSDMPNTGAAAPAMVIVSTTGSNNAHHDVHRLAQGTQEGKSTFGINFGASGRQDFKVGGQIRAVRPGILRLDERVTLLVAARNQLPPGKRLFDLALSASELAVGTTLAATKSRLDGTPDLSKNFIQMVGE